MNPSQIGRSAPSTTYKSLACFTKSLNCSSSSTTTISGAQTSLTRCLLSSVLDQMHTSIIYVRLLYYLVACYLADPSITVSYQCRLFITAGVLIDRLDSKPYMYVSSIIPSPPMLILTCRPHWTPSPPAASSTVMHSTTSYVLSFYLSTSSPPDALS